MRWGIAACVVIPLPCIWLWLHANPPVVRAGWAPLPGIRNTVSLLAAWLVLSMALIIVEKLARRMLGGAAFASPWDMAAVAAQRAAVAIACVLVTSCALRLVDRSNERHQVPSTHAVAVLRTAAELWGSAQDRDPLSNESVSEVDRLHRLLRSCDAEHGSVEQAEFVDAARSVVVYEGSSWLTDAYSISVDCKPGSLGCPVYETFGWPMRVITSHHGNLAAPDVWPVIRQHGIASVPSWLWETIALSRLDVGGLVGSSFIFALVGLVACHGLHAAHTRLKRGKCRHCGYPQLVVSSPVCPECGEARIRSHSD